LIERLWKFTKKQCLYNRYYESFCQFKSAIDDCLDKVKSAFSDWVKNTPKSKILAVRKIRKRDREVYLLLFKGNVIDE
jgi:hypothetical protein